jgi:antitoxin (DNA-binding transcriptional repressor) of toxin-antitoxin stability system
MDNVVSLKELRVNLGVYAERVGKGESFVVMKRSKPLFKIEPIDEGQWETVIDFTKLRKGGIEIGELLSRLRAYDR